MSKKNNNIPLWAQCGHERPTTRREVLAFSTKAFIASVTVPSIAQAITAAQCPSPKMASGMIPFVSIHLSGGAAMCANFLAMGKDGAPISDRSRMGLGKGDIKVEKAFGDANFVGNDNSQMLVGMRSRMGAAEEKTAFVGVCLNAFDDTDKNRFNANGLLMSTGYQGQYLPQLNSLAGNSMKVRPAMVGPNTPLIVTKAEDISNVLNFSGSLKVMNKKEKTKLGQLISKLNQSQLNKLGRSPTSVNARKVIECAGINNEALLGRGGADVNPFTLASHKGRFQSIWSRQTLYGSMIYNALQGYSGPAHIALGGYDYHNSTRSLGNKQDLAAGELIGRIIATADYLKKPIFLMVTTDGATGSPDSTDQQAPWTTDFGRASAVYMLSYNPNKRPTVSKNQLGSLLDSQAADESFLLSSSPERATLGVFANYCSLIGRMDLLNSLPREPFTHDELKSVIAFHKG